MPSSSLRSPFPWLGALLLAGALVVLGHTSAEAAGDDAARDQPDLLATVLATAGDGIGEVEPVTAPVTGALREVPAVDVMTSRQLVPVVDSPPLLRALTGTAIAPLGRTLTDVGAALPAPVGPVAQDVAASLPQPPASDELGPAPQAGPPAPPRRAAQAAPAGLPAPPGWLSLVPADAASLQVAPASPGAPTTPWPPPSLPAGGPGSGGGPASLMAGFGASLAWAAMLTLLLALAVKAWAGMAAPLALRSAMHASRMRRPG